jgi:hypothetical protein
MPFPKGIRGGDKGRVVPGWAAFMDPGEYAEFRSLIRQWLRDHRPEFRELEDGTIEVTLSDGQPLVLGLVNLAQTCHLIPRSEWQAQIALHFGNVLQAPLPMNLTFEQVRTMLKVRLYPEDMGLPDAPLVRRAIAPGVQALVTVDYPTSIRSLTPEDVQAWGKSTDELFELGLANVKAQDVPQLEPLDEDSIQVLAGNSFFTTSWVLMLEEYLKPMPEHGALVILPHRHLVAFAPIEDLTVVEAVQTLLVIAAGQYHQGPGSISPNLYWWRNGELTLLPGGLQGKTIQFAPPDDFNELVLSLPPARG